MKHIKNVSRMPKLAQQGTGIDPAESIILILLTVFFSDYDNFNQVIQSLQKYFSKT